MLPGNPPGCGLYIHMAILQRIRPRQDVTTQLFIHSINQTMTPLLDLFQHLTSFVFYMQHERRTEQHAEIVQ